MKQFKELSAEDAQTLANTADLSEAYKLNEAYQELLAHHIEETATIRAKDRGAILRMAGNIAAGLVQSAPIHGDFTDKQKETYPQVVADVAVAVARAILAEVDK